LNIVIIRTAATCALVLASTAAIADTPRLHPIEEACVEYEMGGSMQEGTTIRCHRNYGYEQYEIQKIEVKVAGFSQSTNNHNIVIGDTIYNIDLDAMTGTKMKNPMYDNMVAALENTDPEDMSAQFIGAMGFSPTGEEKSIAGMTCEVYQANQMGTVCLTGDGLMLEQSFMGMSTVATSVEIGESGDDDNYTLYQQVPITDGPDMGDFNLQDLMNNQN
jgi:hypothetical protein